MRKLKFTTGEFYHIFNRGVDKRQVFMDPDDLGRFFKSITEFNSEKPIGSIFENSFRNPLGSPASKSENLVSFVAYCLNPNHFHFILKQEKDSGIEKFMHRLGTGYTKYFNNKNKRSGVLFQGKFKAKHIDNNEYLLHLSAYVNLNDKVHRIPQENDFLTKSSWNEYILNNDGICEKEIILEQFKNIDEYKDFAKISLEDIVTRKDLGDIIIE